LSTQAESPRKRWVQELTFHIYLNFSSLRRSCQSRRDPDGTREEFEQDSPSELLGPSSLSLQSPHIRPQSSSAISSSSSSDGTESDWQNEPVSPTAETVRKSGPTSSTDLNRHSKIREKNYISEEGMAYSKGLPSADPSVEASRLLVELSSKFSGKYEGTELIGTYRCNKVARESSGRDFIVVESLSKQFCTDIHS
jgi:hypothetical protein